MSQTRVCVYCAEKIDITLNQCPKCQSRLPVHPSIEMEMKPNPAAANRSSGSVSKSRPYGGSTSPETSASTGSKKRPYSEPRSSKPTYLKSKSNSLSSAYDSTESLFGSDSQSLFDDRDDEDNPLYNYTKDYSPDPVLVAILSGCCVAGIGQIVVGQGTKGAAVLIGGFFLFALSGGMSVVPFNIIVAIDAYRLAQKRKAGKLIGKWEWF